MIKDIHARAPINMEAVRVVMFAGEHFEPNKKVLTNDSENPIAITSITKSMRRNQTFCDLTGTRFGRFSIIGLAKEFKGSWVVRCVCGRYSTRKKKAIMNPENGQDRCEHCRHLAFLKYSERYRRTGKSGDIRDF